MLKYNSWSEPDSNVNGQKEILISLLSLLNLKFTLSRNYHDPLIRVSNSILTTYFNSYVIVLSHRTTLPDFTPFCSSTRNPKPNQEVCCLILTDEVKTIEYQSKEKCCNKFGKRLSWWNIYESERVGLIIYSSRQWRKKEACEENNAWTSIYTVTKGGGRGPPFPPPSSSSTFLDWSQWRSWDPNPLPLHLTLLPHTGQQPTKDWSSFRKRKIHLNHLVTNSSKRVRLGIFFLP